MSDVTLRRRLRYRFDNTFSHGVSAMIAWLGVLVLLLVVIFTAVIAGASLAPAPRPDLWHQILNTASAALKFGTFEGSWWYILVDFLLSLAALFIGATLVGLIVSGFNTKIRELSEGRSEVIEEGHTIILGWSEAIFTIVHQLAVANADSPGTSVVILAEEDKSKMEARIRAKVRHHHGLRIVCRKGSPVDSHDLSIANPNSASSIIVLSGGSDDPDVETIKTLLALLHAPGRRAEPFHIVAEIEHDKNLEVAKIVGGDEVTLISKGQTIARLMAHASEQSGIALAYSKLFDYEGDEVFYRIDPTLAGRTYGDALLAYEDCCIIGIHTQDGTTVNPDPDTEIGMDDSIVAIAESEKALARATASVASTDPSLIAGRSAVARSPVHILMLGWNPRAITILQELNEFCARGSKVTMMADTDDVNEAKIRDGKLEHLSIAYHSGDITDRHLLDALNVPSFDSMLVLSEADVDDVQRADARTLITLLHLRDITSRAGSQAPIVSEMLDDHNRSLAQVTKVDDVVVSEKLVSLLMAAVSRNQDLKHVFDDLLGKEGSEIHMKPVERYVTGEASFATIVEAARRLRETAIGYRVMADRGDAKRDFGVHVNPAKSGRFSAAPGDAVIVLAEE